MRITRTPEDVEHFFAAHLRHIEGELAGQPLALAEWQKRDIIRPLFGTLTPEGYRRFRTCYVEVPRKNGKSTLAAGLALYLLFCDQEPGAQVISAAANLSQARICFKMARKMVLNSPMLASRCTIYKDAIETHAGSVYHAISSAADTKDGLNCHGIIFDETHAQKTRDLWDVLESSTGARRQPLLFSITTAGKDKETLCGELHTYARSILDGTIQDDTFLPVIYGAPADADWQDPAVWKMANPGYGISCYEEYFRSQVRKAKANRGMELNFRRKNLCQWTETATGWIPLSRWDACQGSLPDLTGRECIGALDLSSTMDLTALVLCFEVDGQYFLLPFGWAPSGAVEEREKRNKAKYSKWIESNHLFETEGDIIDEDAIFDKIKDLAQTYRIKEMRFDRYKAGYMAQRVMGLGVEVTYFGQGFASMGNACSDFEKLVYSRNLVHDGHPVLRWCLANTSVKTDEAGNRKPDKKVSREKIDLAVASVMAASGARVGSVNGTSIYETRGMLSV